MWHIKVLDYGKCYEGSKGDIGIKMNRGRECIRKRNQQKLHWGYGIGGKEEQEPDKGRTCRGASQAKGTASAKSLGLEGALNILGTARSSKSLDHSQSKERLDGRGQRGTKGPDTTVPKEEFGFYFKCTKPPPSVFNFVKTLKHCFPNIPKGSLKVKESEHLTLLTMNSKYLSRFLFYVQIHGNCARISGKESLLQLLAVHPSGRKLSVMKARSSVPRWDGQVRAGKS